MTRFAHASRPSWNRLVPRISVLSTSKKARIGWSLGAGKGAELCGSDITSWDLGWPSEPRPLTPLPFVGKPDCHLCEDARTIVDDVLADFPGVELVERSILDEPELFEAYV